MKTFEELIAEAAAKGLTLANLFQMVSMGMGTAPSVPYAEWNASFRHANGFRDMGGGKTAVEALQDALDRASSCKGPENRPIPKAPPKLEEAVSLEGML